ncbi:hypothetical protein [Arthrobacter sp. Z4-13]
MAWLALPEQSPELEVPWYTSFGQPWGPSPAAAPETGGIILCAVAAILLVHIETSSWLPKVTNGWRPAGWYQSAITWETT